jgi:hypothetical protein
MAFTQTNGLGFQTQDGMLTANDGTAAGLTAAFHDFGTSQNDAYLQFTDFGHVSAVDDMWLCHAGDALTEGPASRLHASFWGGGLTFTVRGQGPHGLGWIAVVRAAASNSHALSTRPSMSPHLPQGASQSSLAWTDGLGAAPQRQPQVGGGLRRFGAPAAAVVCMPVPMFSLPQA